MDVITDPERPEGGDNLPLHEALTEVLPEVHRAPTGIAAISSPTKAYEAGVRSIKLEQSEAVDRHVDDVREQLGEALKAGTISPKDLIEAVCYRERALAQIGRDVATGKHAMRGLREVVRGLLEVAKTGTPQEIESTLRSLGADPVDRRQIRLNGTSLGSGQTDEI